MEEKGTLRLKTGLAEMLKGGVIMDVTTPSRREIAEEAGAVAVMALERVPADIRADGGVARMADPTMIEAIMAAVTIPVMAKARIGHFVEAQILEALGVDYVDESEVLTPADEKYPHRQAALQGPLRVRGHQPGRGAAAHRRGRGHDPHQGRGRHRQRGGGGAAHAHHQRRDTRHDRGRPTSELMSAAKEMGAPYDLVVLGGGERPPAGGQLLGRGHRDPGGRGHDDAAGSGRRLRGLGHLQVGGPRLTGQAIVRATTHFDDPKLLAEVSRGLGEAMWATRSRR